MLAPTTSASHVARQRVPQVSGAILQKAAASVPEPSPAAAEPLPADRAATIARSWRQRTPRPLLEAHEKGTRATCSGIAPLTGKVEMPRSSVAKHPSLLTARARR